MMNEQTELVYEYFCKTLDEEFISNLDNLFKSDLELAKWLETTFWSQSWDLKEEALEFIKHFPAEEEKEHCKKDILVDTLFELVSELEINFQVIAERLLNQ